MLDERMLWKPYVQSYIEWAWKNHTLEILVYSGSIMRDSHRRGTELGLKFICVEKFTETAKCGQQKEIRDAIDC